MLLLPAWGGQTTPMLCPLSRIAWRPVMPCRTAHQAVRSSRLTSVILVGRLSWTISTLPLMRNVTRSLTCRTEDDPDLPLAEIVVIHATPETATDVVPVRGGPRPLGASPTGVGRPAWTDVTIASSLPADGHRRRRRATPCHYQSCTLGTSRGDRPPIPSRLAQMSARCRIRPTHPGPCLGRPTTRLLKTEALFVHQ